MSQGEFILWWVIAIGGLCGSALFAALETACYCLNRAKMQVRARSHPPDYSSKVLLEEMADPERLLAVQLLGFTICGDLAATALTKLMVEYGWSPTKVLIANVAILTPVFFVLLESVPKELGRLNADSLARMFAVPLRWTRWFLNVILLLPIVRGVTSLITRQWSEGSGLAETSRQKIAGLIRETAESGSISGTQADLFDRALAFAEIGLEDEMVPWNEAIALGRDWDRKRIAKTVVRRPHTVYPVVDERGHPVGVVTLANLCTHSDQPLASILEPIEHVEFTSSAHEALLTLRRSGRPMAMVMRSDKPVGIVTVDDLIDPLVRARTW